MSLCLAARVSDKLLYGLLRHVPRNRAFVFGIGLSKTGTTSLNDAMGILGYRAIHLPPIAKATADGAIRMDWPWWVYKYDALTDLTVAVIHRELHKNFPNARFIYTRRPITKWLQSCEKHFTHELTERRIAQGMQYVVDLSTAFYGARAFDADKFAKAYTRHESDVMSWHEGNANFMSFDLTSGDGWGPLCDFLHKPVPKIPFPISNKNPTP